MFERIQNLVLKCYSVRELIFNWARKHAEYLPVVILFIGYLVTVIRTAWVCDDAFITLRTVDNFVNGFGLTWNVQERVQVYTHPLWMFFISALYAFTREPFFTVIIASIVLCAAAILILFSTHKNRPMILLVPMTIFTLSRSFIDYSTSGLEQPMTFLLYSLFVRLLYHGDKMQRQTAVAMAIAAAATLNRTDSLMLFLPSLIVTMRENRSLRTAVTAVLAFLPFLLWEIFSVFYYGFFSPNTAFVKLGHGIPTLMMMDQGVSYFAESLRNDPITLVTIAAGLSTVVFSHCRRYLSLAIGIVLYLAYIVYIGGDFMSGRFFAAPLFAAGYLLVRFFEKASPKTLISGFVVAVCLGMFSPHPTMLSSVDYGQNRKVWGDLVDLKGIADERGFWFHCSGMLSNKRESGSTDCGRKSFVADLRKKNKKFVESGGVGFLGYYAGRELFIFDSLGITDPLLARLSCEGVKRWRPGHFPKQVPPGYIETLKTGVNSIENKSIRKYYDALHIIVSGNLFSLTRLKEIWKMNTGSYNDLLPKKTLKPINDPVKLLAEYFNERFPIGYKCAEQGMWYYRDPMVFSNDAALTSGGVEVAANDDAEYRIDFLRNGDVIGSRTIPASSSNVGIVKKYCIAAEEYTGFDQIRWQPLVGNFACFSYIRLVKSCGKSESMF